MGACVRLSLALAVGLLAAPLLAQNVPSRPDAQTGTALIRGRVTAADTSRPLRRVRVTVTAPELGGTPRNISTDADGRYEFRGLPAGRYRVTAARSGYLTLQYGQRRPLEQGVPLQVLDGQSVAAVDFVLPRMGVITGRVLDDLGDPIEAVTVMALRLRFWEGRRQLVPTGGGFAFTDDAGEYRVLGLVPGTYYVMATTREAWTVNEDGTPRTMGYAPTYFPGTTNTAMAGRITVGLGQEARGDFSLVAGRAATLSGTAFDSRGRPFSAVNLREEIRGDSFSRMGAAKTATVAADGTFTIRDVTPGEYKLAAGATDPDRPDAAIVPITVDSVDLTDLVLRGSEGGSVTGQVLTDTGTVPAIPRLLVSVGVPPVGLGGFRNPGSGTVAADGSFSIEGVLGSSPFRVAMPDTWMVKAIHHEGLDITDMSIELKSGEVLSGVQIIVTDKVTSVSGRTTDGKGRSLSDATVILFADDAQKWSLGARAVRAVRPDQQGRYQVKGLAMGEYLAIAVDYVEDGMWNDPEFLESLRREASGIVLRDATPQDLPLTVVTPETSR
jgi:hypothetical protein